jgi:DNA-binding CsgD family transcriptional regulator
MLPAHFDDDLARLSRANSLDELGDLLGQQARSLGFEHHVYALRIPTRFSEARLLLIDGYPPGWVTHYFEQGFQDHDPVMAWCAQRVTPVVWSELDVAPSSPAGRVMREAAGFGLVDGISMPLHSPQGERVVLSLACNALSEAPRRARHVLPLLVAHLHEAVRRVSGQWPGAKQPQLTPRERDCLRWTADGKTSAETAMLLTMSENTVNFHLKNAIEKLGASNRQHAVARALLSGLLRPLPF